MSDEIHSDFIEDPEFQQVLAVCLEALQRGESIDREQLMIDYPTHAEAIEQFLHDRAELEQLTQLFLPANDSVTGGNDEVTLAYGATLPRLIAGDTIRYVGDYEVLEEIARGGMGVIFKAKQRTLNRTVALKMILAGKLASVADIERFCREARAAGRLKHPNIVPIHEVGEYEGHHYFTMDLVEGRSLAELVREETLSPQRAAKIVAKVAEAVEYAHQQGTLHRDIKPANILIDAAGKPHVTDFGLAKLMEVEDEEQPDSLTVSGQVLGTPSYMSPEQASGNSALIGPASDIYSLGGILYCSIAGRAPFVAESTVDTIMQVLKKDPVAPRELNPSVPRDLETICLKCLRKEPHQRYGTAQLLADDLQRFLDGRPVQARPVSSPEKTWRWVQRNPTIASLVALSMIFLGAGAIVSTIFAVEANHRADEAEAAKKSTLIALEDAEESERLSERSLYFARIQMAHNHWQHGLVGRTQEILAKTEANSKDFDTANWEMYWLRSLEHQEQQTLLGHHGPVLAVDYNPMKKLIASAGEDGTVRLWGSIEGEQSQLIYSHQGAARSVAWTKDGNYLCSGGDDGILNIWDVEKEQLAAQGSLENDCIYSVTWSPDGQAIATGGKKRQVQIWSFGESSLENVHTLEKVSWPIHAMAWSQQTQKLYVGYGQGRTTPRTDLSIWDVRTWKKSEARDYDIALDYPVSSLAISKTGDLLAATAAHGRVKLLETTEMLEQASFSMPARVTCVKWSPREGEPLLATAGEAQIISIYDPVTKSVKRHLWGHMGRINDLSWNSPNMLVSAGEDGSIKTWDVSRFDEATVRRTMPNYVSEISWAPYNKHLAIAYLLNQAVIWDTSGKRSDIKLQGHKSRIWSISWHPRGNWVATTGMDRTVRIYNAVTGQNTWSSNALNGRGHWVGWSPDGSKLAAKAGDLIVWQFDKWTGQCLVQITKKQAPKYFALGNVAWHPDGVHIASPGGTPRDGALVIWDSRTGKEEKTVGNDLPTSRIRSIAWSPDGKKLLWGDVKGFLNLWDYHRDKPIFSIRAHQDAIGSVRWSPDGKRLATSGWEGTVKVRKADDGEEIIVFRDDLGRMQSLQWSPDGVKLAAGNWSDKHSFVRIWDTSKAHPNSKSPQLSLDSVSSAEQKRPATGTDEAERLPKVSSPPAAEFYEELKEFDQDTSSADSMEVSHNEMSQALLRRLNSEDTRERIETLKALAEFEPPVTGALAELLDMLEREDSHEKVWVIRCLASLGHLPDSVAARLHTILKSDEHSTFLRFEAAKTLAKIGPAGEVAISTLINMLENPGEPEPRRISSGSPSAAGLMAPLFRRGPDGKYYVDDRDLTIMYTVAALASFGAPAADAIPLLEQARDTPESLPAVRELAKKAISHIQAGVGGRNGEK